MPYVYKPYPKWIEADGKRFIVKDEAEHKLYPASVPAPEGMSISAVIDAVSEFYTPGIQTVNQDSARSAYIAIAEARGIKIDKRWSTERIKAALDDNSRPDNH